MKQTAVEWLIEKITEEFAKTPSKITFNPALIDQAKEIERLQHKNTFDHGYYCGRHTSADRTDAWNYMNELLKSK